MMNVLEMIYKDDVISLTFLVTILYTVGTNMANDTVRLWGWRTAAGAYVVFVIWALGKIDSVTASSLARICFRGLFAIGLTVATTWIALAVIVFLYEVFRDVERHIAIRPAAPPPIELSPDELERDRLEQAESEKRQLEMQRRQEQRDRQRASDAMQCEELRLGCELLYSRHSERLQAVLPLERFNALLDSHLSGQTNPQLVGKRTAMIGTMLTDFVSSTNKSVTATFESLQELVQYFATQRREAHELPCDEDTRDSIVTALNNQEDEAIESFFKR